MTFDEINQAFQAQLDRIAGPLTERAVTMTLITVEGNTAPMVPIATSALVNSMYRRTEPTGIGWRGEVGFGANYAAAVHEKPGTLLGTGTPRYPRRLGVVWGPNGQPQFLAKGVENTIPDLPAILREEYSQ